MKSIITNASLTLLLCAIGMAVPGKAADVRPQMTVSYSDIDLGTPAGAMVMVVRMKQAATQVCGGWPETHNPTYWAAYRACFTSAMDGAIAKLNAPLVSSLYGKEIKVADRR